MFYLIYSDQDPCFFLKTSHSFACLQTAVTILVNFLSVLSGRVTHFIFKDAHGIVTLNAFTCLVYFLTFPLLKTLKRLIKVD